MNTQLIADAVRNSRGEAEATIWDRLFAFWFRRLVYTQIWEDPEADLAALRRGCLERQYPALWRSAVADAGCRCAHLLGQAQRARAPAARLFHRRVLSPRHARPLHRPGPRAGENLSDRSRSAAERQRRHAGTDSGAGSPGPAVPFA